MRNTHRRKGVAQLLLDEQLKILIDKDYKNLRTKTYNRWKGMLIFNLKNDFNIIDCLKEDGETAIILEKPLRLHPKST